MDRINYKTNIRALNNEALNLKSIAVRLRAMEIPDLQEIALELEKLSSEIQILVLELKAKARLDDLKIYEVRVKRRAKKRTFKCYKYWYASWREGSKVRNVCLGSTKTTTHEEALIRAQKLKAEYLGVDL